MINIIIALVGTLYASYTDVRTGFVDDWLSHLMIGLGVIYVILTFPVADAVFIYAVAAAVFGVGYLAYIFGQMGGGDVKLFTALVLLIPFYPQQMVPIANSVGITPVSPGYPFILPVFLVSGILFMFFISIIYLRRITKISKKIKDFEKKMTHGIFYAAVFSPFFIIWFIYSPLLVLLLVPVSATMMLMPFKDDIVKLFFAEKKKISDLNEDDVLALEMIDSKTKKKLGLWRKTYTAVELKKIKERAKKHRIHTITVCENMPKYVPYIFMSLVINLFLGDAFIYLLSTGLLY
jgi:hypothetical protein